MNSYKLNRKETSFFVSTNTVSARVLLANASGVRVERCLTYDDCRTLKADGRMRGEDDLDKVNDDAQLKFLPSICA